MEMENKATKKDLLIRWLIVIWFAGLLIGTILFSERNTTNILTMPLALAGTVTLIWAELYGLRRLNCRFEGRVWGVVFLILFSLHFSVVFFFLNKMFFIALLFLAARLILAFVGAVPVTQVRTTIRDQNNREEVITTVHIADEETAKRLAVDEIKNQNPDVRFIDQE